MYSSITLFFVAISLIGAALVGSVNRKVRTTGFALCVFGNIYWIWHHKEITRDFETMLVFAGYLVINSLATANNFWINRK
jgi:hypothetical protein